jgi:hypothetical protein
MCCTQSVAPFCWASSRAKCNTTIEASSKSTAHKILSKSFMFTPRFQMSRKSRTIVRGARHSGASLIGELSAAAMLPSMVPRNGGAAQWCRWIHIAAPMAPARGALRRFGGILGLVLAEQFLRSRIVFPFNASRL